MEHMLNYQRLQFPLPFNLSTKKIDLANLCAREYTEGNSVKMVLPPLWKGVHSKRQEIFSF